jgi:hypothetical protein
MWTKDYTHDEPEWKSLAHAVAHYHSRGFKQSCINANKNGVNLSFERMMTHDDGRFVIISRVDGKVVVEERR